MPADAPDDEQKTTERWTYGGVRVLERKKVHAWLDESGEEHLFAPKRAGHWAVGYVYDVTVIRFRSDPARVQMVASSATFTGGEADDEARLRLSALDRVARAELARITQERNAARRDALDEAMQPLLKLSAEMRTSADRDALIAAVLRRMTTAWHKGPQQ
jgi:hypothetical protein